MPYFRHICVVDCPLLAIYYKYINNQKCGDFVFLLLVNNDNAHYAQNQLSQYVWNKNVMLLLI